MVYSVSSVCSTCSTCSMESVVPLTHSGPGARNGSRAGYSYKKVETRLIRFLRLGKQDLARLDRSE